MRCRLVRLSRRGFCGAVQPGPWSSCSFFCHCCRACRTADTHPFQPEEPPLSNASLASRSDSKIPSQSLGGLEGNGISTTIVSSTFISLSVFVHVSLEYLMTPLSLNGNGTYRTSSFQSVPSRR